MSAVNVAWKVLKQDRFELYNDATPIGGIQTTLPNFMTARDANQFGIPNAEQDIMRPINRISEGASGDRMVEELPGIAYPAAYFDADFPGLGINAAHERRAREQARQRPTNIEVSPSDTYQNSHFAKLKNKFGDTMSTIRLDEIATQAVQDGRLPKQYGPAHILYGSTPTQFQRKGNYARLMEELLRAGIPIVSEGSRNFMSGPFHTKFQQNLPDNVEFEHQDLAETYDELFERAKYDEGLDPDTQLEEIHKWIKARQEEHDPELHDEFRYTPWFEKPPENYGDLQQFDTGPRLPVKIIPRDKFKQERLKRLAGEPESVIRRVTNPDAHFYHQNHVENRQTVLPVGGEEFNPKQTPDKTRYGMDLFTRTLHDPPV